MKRGINLAAGVLLILLAIPLGLFCSQGRGAVRMVEQGRIADAADYYTHVIARKPVQKALFEHYADGALSSLHRRYTSGSLTAEQAEEAIDYLAEVCSSDFSRKAGEYRTQIEAYRPFRRALEDGDYLTAADLAAGFPETSQNRTGAMQAFGENRAAYRAAVTQTIEALDLTVEADLEEAARCIGAAKLLLPRDSEIGSLHRSIGEKYEKYILSAVKEQVNAHDHGAAERLLSDAIQKLPESRSLEKRLRELQNNRPKSPEQLSGSKLGYFSRPREDAVDFFGTVYPRDSIHTTTLDYMGHQETELQLQLDGKYSRLYGTLVLGTETRDGSCCLQILGKNDKVLTATPAIELTTAPQRFHADLTGLTTVTIRVIGINSNSESAQVILADLEVY